jgi:hypothetical protein
VRGYVDDRGYVVRGYADDRGYVVRGYRQVLDSRPVSSSPWRVAW